MRQAACIRLSASLPSWWLARAQVTKDKDAAVRGQDFEKAGQLRDREMELKAKIQVRRGGAALGGTVGLWGRGGGARARGGRGGGGLRSPLGNSAALQEQQLNNASAVGARALTCSCAPARLACRP